MHPRAIAAVAVGGAIGAGARWGIVEATEGDASWPWGIFVANLIGCAVLGFLVGAYRSSASTHLYLGATAGFCGSLTTFSAFAVDIAVFLRDDDWTLVGGYLGSSVIAGVALFTSCRLLGQALAARGGP